MMSGLIKAEFHFHSIYSPDSLVKLEDFLSACEDKGINKVAITDHGTMRGGLRAKEMDPDRVILAEEIETTQGEILGYFMTEEIPQGLEPEIVIERLQKQGAFISFAHPFDPYRGNGWQPGTLDRLALSVDGIEVFNARCIREQFNHDAYSFAMKHSKLQMVGSDAHSVFELGQACLSLPDFNSAEEMRRSVAQSHFVGERSGSCVHLISTYAKFVKSLQGK